VPCYVELGNVESVSSEHCHVEPVEASEQKFYSATGNSILFSAYVYYVPK